MNTSNFATEPIWLALPETLTCDPIDPRQRYDVVVVGAGIVGLTTAVLAAREGLSVAVLEGRFPGAGTTGRSTAKGSVLQGALSSRIAARHGAEVAQSYLAANLEGLALLREQLQESAVPWRTATAWSYATGAAGAEELHAEQKVLTGAGIAAELADTSELPYRTEVALRVTEQLQFDPSAYVAWLTRQAQANGVPVAWPVRARGVAQSGEGELIVEAVGESGPLQVRATWVVLATLLPFPLRTAMFATTTANRSYIVAGACAGPIPLDMYLSVGPGPSRSLRTATGPDGEEWLLVGGNGHPTGKRLPSSRHLAELAAWAQEHFGLTAPIAQWSAQDYESADLLPHIGQSPLGPPRMLLASGFGKWGMTNGSAAALALVGEVRGSPPVWSKPMRPRLARGVRGKGRLAVDNLAVGLGLARGWVWDPALRDGAVAQGHGRVMRHHCAPVAVSNADGMVRSCSAVCTHLGGVVRWNDVERSWDCPLHGSRFGPAGQVLEAPAVAPLAAAPLPGSGTGGVRS